jgi:putative NIF3 family GTP cyclohydrolase 1 type 2
MGITVRALREHFFSVAKWVDPRSTCDQITYGSPDREVFKIGTGWVPCSQNLEAAATDGCDLFISHEAFFHGNWAPDLDSRDTAWGRNRMEILKQYDMACMNQHDTWDNFPVYGIRDSWRAFLGLTELIEERPYYYPGGNRFATRNSLALCRVAPQRLGDFAGRVAALCGVFPTSPGVTVHGSLDDPIRTVATGVGCHIPTLEMLELGADLLVLTFDRAFQTTIRIPLAELGARMIVVEHGVSEMPGMKSMATYLEKTFPGIDAKFYCHEPAAQTIKTKATNNMNWGDV